MWRRGEKDLMSKLGLYMHTLQAHTLTSIHMRTHVCTVNMERERESEREKPFFSLALLLTSFLGNTQQ